MPETRPLRVFLCHAKQDKPFVLELYTRLFAEGWVEPWLDKENILPGQDWDLEIKKAVRNADVIIVALSRTSITKEGYIQKEIGFALDVAEEKPEGSIFIIPLRLDDSKVPEKLIRWQYLDYSGEKAYEKLIKSLNLRAESLGLDLAIRIDRQDELKRKKSARQIFTFGGIEFVKVPAGGFFMGSDRIEYASPQHSVYDLKSDFYMGRFPITNVNYANYSMESGRTHIWSPRVLQHPVVNISWYDALGFINWLNGKYQSELPDGYRFCLPSEAEWEKAARGPEGNEYPWGNSFDEKRCNTAVSGRNNTTPVGFFSPEDESVYGCSDMVGNVWEWTRSLWGKSFSAPSFNYPYHFNKEREDVDADGETLRVLRGGSFTENQSSANAMVRDGDLPGERGFSRGFRLAVSPIEYL